MMNVPNMENTSNNQLLQIKHLRQGIMDVAKSKQMTILAVVQVVGILLSIVVIFVLNNTFTQQYINLNDRSRAQIILLLIGIAFLTLIPIGIILVAIGGRLQRKALVQSGLAMINAVLVTGLVLLIVSSIFSITGFVLLLFREVMSGLLILMLYGTLIVYMYMLISSFASVIQKTQLGLASTKYSECVRPNVKKFIIMLIITISYTTLFSLLNFFDFELSADLSAIESVHFSRNYLIMFITLLRIGLSFYSIYFTIYLRKQYNRLPFYENTDEYDETTTSS